MADKHAFETEAGMLVGALGALLHRGPDEGACPNAFEDYCLMSLLQQQAQRVHDIGMALLFPDFKD